MFLRYRPLSQSDLTESFFAFRDKHLYNDEDIKNLFLMWSELISSGSAITSLIEDRHQPVGKRIAYVCLCAPVSDEFVRQSYEELPPGIGYNVLRLWLSKKSPVLSLREIQSAYPHSGINLACLHTGLPDSLQYPEEAGRVVRDKIVTKVPEMLGGYRLKELILEAYCDWQHDWCRQGGFQLRNGYEAFNSSNPIVSQQTGLYGISHQEAKSQESYPFSHLFTYSAPILGFTRAEQWLLLHALSNSNDHELSELLSLSRNTLKKQWSSIFSKVDAFPALMPENAVAVDFTSQVRGPEKRRALIDYLRQHPEELRPT